MDDKIDHPLPVDTTHSPASSNVRPESAGDLLLKVAVYLSRLKGKSVSPEVLTAGLPLVNGRLTPDLLPRALNRAGLVLQPVKLKLIDLPEFDLPAVLTLGDGEVAVLVEKNADSSFLAFDAATEQTRTLSASELGTLGERMVFLVKDSQKAASQSADDATQGQKKVPWLREALSGHKRSIMHVVLAAVFVNVFAIAMPIFTLNVYDRVLPNKATSTLWVLAIGLIVVQIFDLLLKVARAAIIDYVGRRIDLRLSSVLFDRVINTTIGSRPGSTGAFVNRITQYEVLRDFLTSSTIVMFVDLLFMGVFVYVIASLIGWIVIFPLIAAVIAISATLIIGMRSGNAVKAALQESATRNAILVEALSAAQTIKSTRAEGQFLQRWENAILSSSETQNRIKGYQSVATQITALAGQISMIAIIIGGTYRFSEGEISTGAIIASMMLSNRLIAPIGQISAALLRSRSALEAYRTLQTILALPDEREMQQNFYARSIDNGKVELRKVRFAYPESDNYVLDNISLTINPGEKVGIIGRIGSGKTTLGRLLVGFYEPSEGEILIDGVSIKQYHPAVLRRQIGFVLQDPELFSGTVRENLILADPTASDERILDVARRAGVEEFVARHPKGYDMPVGERGCLLSGGQRQAIALARTMLVNPRILFLDEPSSSMDLATERQLIKHLGISLDPEHTVIIATHRHSLLSLVTRLIVIDNGHIIADGPREKVLEQLRSSSREAV